MNEKKVRTGRLLKAEELSAFNLQMAMMLKAGIMPSTAVETLGEDSTDKRETAILNAISAEINKGAPFYAALELTGRFPEYMVNMVRIGETTGRLDTVTEQLAKHYDDEAQLSESVKQAAVYPGIMLTLMIAVVIVLTAEVLPIFQNVYNELGITFSPLADAFLAVGRVSSTILWVITGVIGFALVCFLAVSLIPGGKKAGKKIMNGMFGSVKMIKNVSLSRFCSAVAMMLYSGMNYTEAAKSAKTLVTNAATVKKVDNCIELLESGKTLSSATSESDLITGLPASLLSAGIKSGSVDRAMAEVARRYTERADSQINKTVGMIEPALVITLCVVVGLVLLSVMLPLVGIMTKMGA